MLYNRSFPKAVSPRYDREIAPFRAVVETTGFRTVVEYNVGERGPLVGMQHGPPAPRRPHRRPARRRASAGAPNGPNARLLAVLNALEPLPAEDALPIVEDDPPGPVAI